MRRNRVVAGLVAAALLALIPSAANADSKWFQDARGDIKASVDVHRVRLVNGTPVSPAVVVLIEQRTLLAGDGFKVWFDTDPGDVGPEYRADWVANSDSLGLSKVDSFADPGARVACPRLRIRSAQDDPGEYSRVSMPPSCLGDHDDLRVSVLAQRQFPQHIAKDWAPGVLHFYPWVARD